MNILKNILLHTMNDTVKRPVRATIGSAGHDIFSPITITIPAKEKVEFSLPFYFEKIGDTIDFEVKVFMRSSFGIKKKIRLINKNKIAIYIKINPFNKDNKITLYNDNKEDIIINKDEHFAQFVITSKRKKKSTRVKYFPISEEAKTTEIITYKKFINSSLITNKFEGTKYILEEDELILNSGEQRTLATALKCEIPQGNFLGVYISKDYEEKVHLANGAAVIDADYFSNPTNDGHLLFAIVNGTDKEIKFNGKEPIIDLIAEEYYVLEEELENPVLNDRISGIGSTNKKAL